MDIKSSVARFATLLLLLLGGAGMALGANTVKTVTQVSSEVTVSEDVDYVISSTTPFAEGGVVNITNTEHAVVIIENIRPSKVISSWLSGHVKINGVQAKDGTNCQVRMYAQGAIIFPYSSSIKPLTVFSEQSYQGTSCNNFGLESSNGYMNTLSAAKLNNKIRSFKLKRGYMVTFSTRAEGRGYSRCFIADREDLEIPSLPTVLDMRISSYRVFQWYNAQKKGIADCNDKNAINALNASWCYRMWPDPQGLDYRPDVEYVTHHYKEGYPSPSTLGNQNFSCHMKTNNEPGNSADEAPCSVDDVLAGWEDLMRTGLRLCSESSHDGSMNHLKAFIDSIDARGWRCDILDLHCYWPSSSFNEGNLTWYSNHYGNGRPIWISEWVWGASWNNNGAFAVSDRNDYKGNWANCYNGTKPILDLLNSHSRVERYAYWNSEANCSKAYLDGQLSTYGQYYANCKPGLGYNKANEFVPTLPRQYGVSQLTGDYDKEKREITLSWSEKNGEYNQYMVVQSKKVGSTIWTTTDTITCLENGGSYKHTMAAADGVKFRILLVDLKGTKRTSNEVTALNQSLEAGDAISIGEKELYLGGNLLPNGNFDFGTLDWYSGTGAEIKAPYFEVVPVGGLEGPYLQCYGGSTDAKSEQSLNRVLALKRNTYYYASAAGCYNNPSFQRISTSAGTLETNVRVQLQNVSEWAKQGAYFEVTSDTVCYVRMRSTAGVAQLDEVLVAQLFESREEALANAMECAKARAAMCRTYCQKHGLDLPGFAEQVEAAATPAEVEAVVLLHLKAIEARDHMVEMRHDLELTRSIGLMDASLLVEADASWTAADYVHYDSLYTAMLEENLKFAYDRTHISSPSFASTTGWNTKTGTYTGGDQRTATQSGKNCWNAWWSLSASGNESQTMAISQQLSNLPTGLYALECKASTQHLCANDQHASIRNIATDQSCDSKALPYGLLDLPNYSNTERWYTLVTPYLFVNEGETVEISFSGSKSGAVDKSWMKYGDPTSSGDNREGWWCATDFVLRYIPIVTRQADAAGWGSICLPYDFSVSAGVKVYRLAGLLADGSAVCLEPETDALLAGKPYIFHLDEGVTTAIFFENPSVSTDMVDYDYHGLAGIFYNLRYRYPIGSMALQDGQWVYYAARGTAIPSYTAYIDEIPNLTVLASWDGLKLPVSDPEAVRAVGIQSVTREGANAVGYNLSGQRVHSRRGLLIEEGKVIFIK